MRSARLGPAGGGEHEQPDPGCAGQRPDSTDTQGRGSSRRPSARAPHLALQEVRADWQLRCPKKAVVKDAAPRVGVDTAGRRARALTGPRSSPGPAAPLAAEERGSGPSPRAPAPAVPHDPALAALRSSGSSPGSPCTATRNWGWAHPASSKQPGGATRLSWSMRSSPRRPATTLRNFPFTLCARRWWCDPSPCTLVPVRQSLGDSGLWYFRPCAVAGRCFSNRELEGPRDSFPASL